MPNLIIDWPKLGENPYGPHFLVALKAFVDAFNSSISSAAPRPLGPVASPGTVSGPGAAADHVHSVEGLATTADLNNLVISAGGTPPSRTISTGTGLTGGGDLTSDRTISVVFGTTGGTVMAGDDSRITGALQSDITLGSPSGVALTLRVTGDPIPRWALHADSGMTSGEAPVAISTVAGTSTVTVTTAANHGYGTGDVVQISDVGGMSGVNGSWTIVRTSATAFTLTGATGSGSYTSGGQAQRNIGGTGSALEGVWNFLAPDSTRDGVVIRGREGSTAQLWTVRDYLGAPIISCGQVGGLGVYGDNLFTTRDVYGRAGILNSDGGLRVAAGDPAGSLDTIAIGNAATPPTGNPDGTHLGEGSFTTAAGVVVWAQDGRLRARTSAGHEDELHHPVRRRTASISAAGGDTALVVQGTLPPAVASASVTVTVDDQATGPLVRYTADATAGVDTGLISPFGVLQAQWAPYFYARVRTDPTAISQTRLWVGLTDSELASLAAAPTTQHVAGFRYDSGLDGTAFWRTVTCDGSSATTTTTTAAIAVDSSYELAVEIDSAGTAVRFWISGVLVATHTTHLPGSTAALAYIARLRTLATASRAIRIGRLAWSAK